MYTWRVAKAEVVVLWVLLLKVEFEMAFSTIVRSAKVGCFEVARSMSVPDSSSWLVLF